MTEYAAIDLGASSGRVVIGRLADGVVALEELPPVPEPARAAAGRAALEPAAPVHGGGRARCAGGRSPASASTRGASTTRCSTRSNRVLGLPFHYRDSRTEGASGIGGYEITGIQDMPINTVYQLLADDRVAEAHAIALVPDLLAYWLSGELANERTNASTTGLLDARTGEWALRADRARRVARAAVRCAGRAGRLPRPCARDRRARLHRRLARHRVGVRRHAGDATARSCRPAPGRCSASSCPARCSPTTR